MTPMVLLDEVKTRFLPLLITDQQRLVNIVKQSLRTYQDRAGVLRTIDTDAVTIERPVNALELVTASDNNGNYVECREYRTPEGVVLWELQSGVTSAAPYRITYLLHLADIDLDNDDLPRGTITLIGDYIECLIDIENTKRLRMANQTAGLPTDGLRSDSELIERKTMLEEQMQETAESLPIIVTC